MDAHKKNDELVVYGYRYDEVQKGILPDTDFNSLKKYCVLKNPT